MPIEIIPSNARGKTQIDWLTSYHSFSFGSYYDPKRVHFGALRVLNDDKVAPGGGFAPHEHDNMEIVTLVLEGALEHKDSLGSHGVIHKDEVQRMTAGSGIQHSEFNASQTEKVHFLQIWVIPKEQDLEPSYEQKELSHFLIPNQFNLIVSPQKNTNALFIHQEAFFWFGRFAAQRSVSHAYAEGRGGYLFIVEGSIEMDGRSLQAGDAAQITGERSCAFTVLNEVACLLIEVNL